MMQMHVIGAAAERRDAVPLAELGTARLMQRTREVHAAWQQRVNDPRVPDLVLWLLSSLLGQLESALQDRWN